jgi:hypothetical protein
VTRRDRGPPQTSTRPAVPGPPYRGCDVLGPAEQVVAEVRERVIQLEAEMRAHRAKTGARLIGRRAVLAQSWRASPTSVEPRRNLRPRFAGGHDVRMAALIAYQEFSAAYRDARRAWTLGLKAIFPPGTYWLARFAPITVAPLAT